MWHSVTRWVVHNISEKKFSAYVFEGQTIQKELQIGLHDPDDEDTTFLQNVGNHSSKDTA